MDTTRAHLTAIERLCARPFPAQRCVEGRVESGPGFHLAELDAVDGLWGQDMSAVQDAREEFESELQVLVQVLTYRWGEPERTRLTGRLERAAKGEPVPEPLRTLSGLVGEVYAWRVEGRWVGLGITREEPEPPPRLQLFAAIGEEDVR
ncbi:hypothetical protein [Streptomyces sp. 8N616]|uniref:hypothetical protein n=1 Tax=Streptomyces sp. 8N616 TaxID=3457414 RepID=UPI003FD20844